MPVTTNYLTIGPVPENGVFLYTGVLTIADGKTPIPANALQTLKLTITDAKTGQIINSKNQSNVMNLLGVTVDITGGTGVLSWTPSPADNPIIELNPNALDGGMELHEAIFQWTWQAPDLRILQSSRKVFIQVEKYAPNETPIQPGTGASAVTINLGHPNINVWVSSDALGNNRVSGTLTTDSRGLVTFQLINGQTYYLWTAGIGFTPILGQPFVATQDTVL